MNPYLKVAIILGVWAWSFAGREVYSCGELLFWGVLALVITFLVLLS